MLERIKKEANTFLLENYQMPLQIPIERNNRLRASLGRFVYQKLDEPVKIDLAGFLLDYGANAIIVDVLKHECIHYALFQKGLPHEDGHPYFEEELKKYGVSSTYTKKVGVYTLYECKKCKKVGETKNNRLVKKPSNYRTVCCHGKIEIIGDKVYDGLRKQYLKEDKHEQK